MAGTSPAMTDYFFRERATRFDSFTATAARMSAFMVVVDFFMKDQLPISLRADLNTSRNIFGVSLPVFVL